MAFKGNKSENLYNFLKILKPFYIISFSIMILANSFFLILKFD